MIHPMVARPVARKEIESDPDEQTSAHVEWKTLGDKKSWDYSAVCEWSQRVKEAKRRGEKVHVGKIIEICGEREQTSEGKASSHVQFKGRTVFERNPALFAEMGSARPKQLTPMVQCLGFVRSRRQVVVKIIRLPKCRGQAAQRPFDGHPDSWGQGGGVEAL